MTHVLVTGASGLLGRAVASELRRRGDSVRTFQRSPSGLVGDGYEDALGTITSTTDIEYALDGIEAVVHLAATVSLAGNAADFDAVNVGGTANLLTAAARQGIERVVHVSSPSVAHAGASIVGADALPADPAAARGVYARTKALGERLALDRDSPVLRVVVVRPHLVWGPGDTQLVGRIVARSASGRLPLLDHGTALIDSLYIDNAATGIAQALARVDDIHGNAYILTNGEPRPVAELLAGICRAAGVRAPTRSIPSALARTAGTMIEGVWRLHPGRDEPPMTRFLAEQLSTAHWFDQRRSRSDLRWEPEVSIDEGFARLAAWYGSSGGRR